MSKITIRVWGKHTVSRVQANTAGYSTQKSRSAESSHSVMRVREMYALENAVFYIAVYESVGCTNPYT